MSQSADPDRPTAILAEDDPVILRVSSIALERSGFAVTTVTDGAQALQLLEDTLPDVVILDGMMPNMDGLETCRPIRGDDRASRVPGILLSARSQDTDEEAARDAGATAYIRKPFDALTLGARVRESLNGKAPS